MTGSNISADPDSSSSPVVYRLARELDLLHAENRLRTLTRPAGVPLDSNDYLALARDPRLKRAVLDAVDQTGSVASTGSRLLSGNGAEWESVEAEFAAFVGAEAALFFSSGYSANVGLLSAVLRPGDLVFSDASNHASLIDGIRLSRARKVIFPHLDLNFLVDQLRRAEAEPCERFIVIESLFSMEGDSAPLAGLAAIAERYGAALIVDEAHATGVCGPEGRGCVAAAGLQSSVLACLHTCGKALASAGAFVTGPETLKQYLVNRARTFIFSTALPPYIAAQISAALKLVRIAEDRREHVRSLAARMRASFQERGFDCGASDSHMIPVILGSNERALAAAERLVRAGYSIRAIRPPTVPAGAARLRISVNAALTKSDCERVAQVLTGL